MSGDAPHEPSLLPNLWDEARAAALDEPGRLLYRSNLLGSDLRITNFGGGNTSAKVDEIDPLTGERVKVLWVKGSGGDIGSMKLDGFSTLYMDKLLSLKKVYRGLAHEDEMVALFNHCTFNLNPRATSIDTPLHGFVPHPHVDHVHADAVIAIAACENAEALTREVYGDEMGFLPWQRPGFDLGLKLGAMAAANPHYKGVVLGSHGLFTWGADLEDLLRDHAGNDQQGQRLAGAPRSRRRPLAARRRRRSATRRGATWRQKLLPAIRKRISSGERKVGHFTDAPEVLEFVNSRDLRPLAALGTSCPDHFLRTKIRPMVLAFDPAENNLDQTIASLDEAVAAYRADYAGYYERCKRANSPAMRDPNAVIYLVPGVGMLSFAKDKATARIASEFYVNAINVMRGASSVSKYIGLPEQEAFDIEYWLLEEAKLQRMPKPKSLAGRIALVTGGAGGIGQAIAARLMTEGACVVLADIDAESLQGCVKDFGKRFGADVIGGAKMDVTSEASVEAAFREATLALWRARHRRLQRRHRLGGAVRGHHARSLEPQHVDPRDRLFPRRALGLSPDEGSGPRRLDRVHRLEERNDGVARRRGLLHGEGCGGSSRALPGARRRGVRHSHQYGQPGCGAAGLEDLAGRMAHAACGFKQSVRDRSRGSLSSALAAEARGVSGGYRGGGVLFRVRSGGEMHREYLECRRGQCGGVHEVSRPSSRACRRTRRRCSVLRQAQDEESGGPTLIRPSATFSRTREKGQPTNFREASYVVPHFAGAD